MDFHIRNRVMRSFIRLLLLFLILSPSTVYAVTKAEAYASCNTNGPSICPGNFQGCVTQDDTGTSGVYKPNCGGGLWNPGYSWNEATSCPAGSTGTYPSCTCSAGQTFDPMANTCTSNSPSLDCSGQPGTYADCAANQCVPVPNESGPSPPYADGGLMGADGECGTMQDPISSPACDYGSACLAAGGILSRNNGECGGLPTSCVPDSPPPPVPALANHPAPDFPESGQPCVGVSPSQGIVVCAKNSPDKPSGDPDKTQSQGNDGEPGGGPGEPGDNSGTGNGPHTDGGVYDDDNGDGVPDGYGGPGGTQDGGNGDLGGVEAGLDKIHNDLSGTFTGSAASLTPGTVTAGTGPDYTATDKTYQSVYDGFKSRVNASQIVTSVNSIFSVSVAGGACPVWSADVDPFGTITIDAQCSAAMQTVWPIIYAVVLATCTFLAVRWAFL